MAYDTKQSKSYNQPAEALIKSAAEVIKNLGGKETKKSNPAKGKLDANFNKKVGGDFVNNRVQLEVKVDSQSAEQSTLSVQAYPVDPVGMKLMFGVRGKPAHKVVAVFFNSLDAELGVA